MVSMNRSPRKSVIMGLDYENYANDSAVGNHFHGEPGADSFTSTGGDNNGLGCFAKDVVGGGTRILEYAQIGIFMSLEGT